MKTASILVASFLTFTFFPRLTCGVEAEDEVGEIVEEPSQAEFELRPPDKFGYKSHLSYDDLSDWIRKYRRESGNPYGPNFVMVYYEMKKRAELERWATANNLFVGTNEGPMPRTLPSGRNAVACTAVVIGKGARAKLKSQKLCMPDFNPTASVPGLFCLVAKINRESELEEELKELHIAFDEWGRMGDNNHWTGPKKINRPSLSKADNKESEEQEETAKEGAESDSEMESEERPEWLKEIRDDAADAKLDPSGPDREAWRHHYMIKVPSGEERFWMRVLASNKNVYSVARDDINMVKGTLSIGDCPEGQWSALLSIMKENGCAFSANRLKRNQSLRSFICPDPTKAESESPEESPEGSSEVRRKRVSGYWGITIEVPPGREIEVMCRFEEIGVDARLCWPDKDCDDLGSVSLAGQNDQSASTGSLDLDGAMKKLELLFATLAPAGARIERRGEAGLFITSTTQGGWVLKGGGKDVNWEKADIKVFLCKSNKNKDLYEVHLLVRSRCTGKGSINEEPKVDDVFKPVEARTGALAKIEKEFTRSLLAKCLKSLKLN